jgi:AcrR family transcriptional regulator
MMKIVAGGRDAVNPYPRAMPRGQVRTDDGRAARSQRTRDAAVAALLDLLREGVVAPTVADIAARTGVTPRSIHANFPSVEALHRAAVDRATAEVLARIRPIDAAAPLAERIEALARQRATIHEHLAPLRRASRVREDTSPPLAEARATALEAGREQIDRIFATELARLAPAERRRRAAALDAVAGDGSWELWRGSHGLTAAAARRTMAEALTRLLADGGDG